MKTKLNCILLVDDDDDCNEYHKIIIEKMECTDKIEVANDGAEALAFLLSSDSGGHPKPAIIFLDINMPGMNGWEFLEEYKKLDEKFKAKIVLVMLTTSINPDDRNRAFEMGYINGFQNKFLTAATINEILLEHFPEYL